MLLSDIRHQQRAISVLRRSLESGRTHHAYLFDGPDGVGKETAALALAARLLCSNAGGDPNQGGLFGDAEPADPLDACGGCESCTLLTSNNHPDFHLIHRGLKKLHPDRTIRASKGLFLVVELVRHFLIEPSMLKPSIGERRVFVIREAERMNEAAQNALLKTLEEPPGNCKLILVTSSAERLLQTIRSRCQRIPFGLLPPTFVAEQLAARTQLAPIAAQTLAGLSGGRLGEALRWSRIDLLAALDETTVSVLKRDPADPEAFAKEIVGVAEALAGRTLAAGEGLDEADENGESTPTGKAPKTIPTDALRDAVKLTLMLVSELYRDALLRVTSADASLLHLTGHAQQTQALAKNLRPDDCERAIQATSTAELMLDRNVAAQLACERLAAGLDGLA